MNNPNVESGKPSAAGFSGSFVLSVASEQNFQCALCWDAGLGSPSLLSVQPGREVRSARAVLAEELPFKRYVDSVGDPVRRSMLLAQVQLETGKHPSTVDRYLYGVTRPDGQNRRAIAFVVGKFTGRTVSGDELFPAAYSYSGRLRRPGVPSGRRTERRPGESRSDSDPAGFPGSLPGSDSDPDVCPDSRFDSGPDARLIPVYGLCDLAAARCGHPGL